MKIATKLTAAALGCAMALSLATGASAAGSSALAGLKNAAPQSSLIEVRRGRGVGIAAGIIAGAAAAAIISGAARAERRRDYHGDRCGYWDYKCSQGHGWACRKYDNRCIGDY